MVLVGSVLSGLKGFQTNHFLSSGFYFTIKKGPAERAQFMDSMGGSNKYY